MSSNPFANEDVMEDYMSALLTDEAEVDEVKRHTVEKLLNTAPIAEQVESIQKITKKPIQDQANTSKVIETKVEEQVVQEKQTPSVEISTRPTQRFQVLLFEVGGMTLAVPLTELGGIHEIDTINPLFGKPSWFKGVLLHRDEKYQVVDTVKWIMPEKSAEKVAESTKYQYLIVLGESGWGLGCERLVNTETLEPDDVKWRDVTTSRPWLSGMVKKKMCALVNVPQLISMFSQGLGSKD